LKKIVVVVNKDKEVLIEGDNLKIIDKVSTSSQIGLLVIMDGIVNIAVFQEWLYWKKIE